MMDGATQQYDRDTDEKEYKCINCGEWRTITHDGRCIECDDLLLSSSDTEVNMEDKND